MRCAKCDHEADDLSPFCSATNHLICQGREPVAGCGSILTAEERHYYGDCCEQCEAQWCERMNVWRHGGEDEVLDRMFSSPERFQ